MSMNPFSYIAESAVREACASLPPNSKNAKLLLGAWDAPWALGVVVADHTSGQGEVHEKYRDVWYVLRGSGAFILGGALVSPENTKPGEWVADAIEGGETRAFKAGDIIDIPPGTPHKFEVLDGRAELLVVKIRTA